MTKKTISLRLALGTSAIALAPIIGAGFASAQDADADEARRLNTVTVNATKRDANETDIPIAIEVFGGGELEGNGIGDLEDITLLSPSVTIAAGGGYASPFIRGIGSQTVGPGIYGSVAYYIDGVYQPNQIAMNTGVGSLDNAESVQVLKGPQGTLYGRNATGGAILVTTNTPEPGQTFSGFGQVELGDFGLQRYKGGVSFGLGDKAAASLDFSIHENDGFVENLGVRNNLDNEDGYRIGGKLALQPTEQFNLVLSGSYFEDDESVISGQQVAQFDTFAALPGLNNAQTFYAGTVVSFISGGVLAAGGTQADADAAVAAAFPTLIGLASGIEFPSEFGVSADNALSGFQNGVFSESGPFPSSGSYENTHLAANATLSFDTFDLVSITSYIEASERNAVDALRADPATLPDLTVLGLPAIFNQGNIGFSQPVDTEAFSQEIYAVSTGGSIDWIIGANYFDNTGVSRTTGDALGTSALLADNEFGVESISAYGEVTYPVTDTLSATAGLRFTDEEYTINDRIVSPVVPNVGNLSAEEDQLTYNAKLTYDNGDLLVYGGVTTGFKSGALNALGPSAGQVAPEELTSYEIGFKADVNSALRLSGAAFYYDFQNIQLNVTDPATGVTFLIDGVEAGISGAEFSAEAILTDSLDVFANAVLLDHEFDSDATIIATGVVQPITGNKLPQTADFAASIGANYSRPLQSGAEINARILGNYNSGYWFDQLNLNGTGGTDNGGYTVANASIGYVSASGFWTLSGYVNNIFDEEYFTSGAVLAGGLSQLSSPGRPQHAGVRLRVDF